MPTGALSLPFRLQADRCQDSMAETKLLMGFDYRGDETSKFEAARVFALTASVAAAPVTFKSYSFRVDMNVRLRADSIERFSKDSDTNLEHKQTLCS